MKIILMVTAAFWLIALGFLALDNAFAAHAMVM